MDTAMRDLDQIEERDGDDEGSLRRAGVFVLAAGVTLTLVYAMASMLGETPEPAAADEDPLAALAAGEELAAEAAAAEEEEPTPVEVDREALRFPTSLLGDDRPEVAAALAAAAAEHETLEAGGDTPQPRMQPVAFPPLTATLPTTLPAAAQAGPEASALVETARRDPMVAAALPARERVERGSVGRDGRYTLQVISYRTGEEAEVFAEALRGRGHDAFVQDAEVEGRGRFFRVRIGPFETMGAAERYRRRFEADEQMNTFVVRNRDD